MTFRPADPHIAGQDAADVQQRGSRDQPQQDEDPVVLFQVPGQDQQGQGGKEIPFVHHPAQVEQQGQQDGPVQRQVAKLSGKDKGGEGQPQGQDDQQGRIGLVAEGEQGRQRHQGAGRRSAQAQELFLPVFPVAQEEGGQGGQGQKQTGQQREQGGGGAFDPHPVRPDQEVQVAGVDRGVGVIAHGPSVQGDQPAEGLVSLKGQDQGRRQQEGDPRPDAEADQGPAQSRAVLSLRKQVQPQGGQAHGPEHQGLGLDQHGGHIGRQGEGPAALDGSQHRDQKEEHHHAVRLAPARPGQEDGRVQQVEKARHQRGQGKPSAAQGKLFFFENIGGQEARPEQVGQDGRQLDQPFGSGRPEPPAQGDEQAQDPDVSGRVIAKAVRIIKDARPILRHALPPGDKIAHVHVIAVNEAHEDQAEEQGDQEQNQQSLCRRHRAAGPGDEGPPDQQYQVQPGEKDQQSGGKKRSPASAAGCLGAFFIPAVFRVPGGGADPVGQGVHPRQGDPVEPGFALRLPGITAQAGKDRHKMLVRPGAAVKAHLPPFAFGIIEGLRKSVYPRHGQVRAHALPAGRLDPAGQAVQAVRLHGDVRGKAGVVGDPVFDVAADPAVPSFVKGKNGVGLAVHVSVLIPGAVSLL